MYNILKMSTRGFCFGQKGTKDMSPVSLEAVFGNSSQLAPSFPFNSLTFQHCHR